MTRWIEVPITQDIIDEAVPADYRRCVVAIALDRATPHAWSVSATDARIMTSYRGSRIWRFPAPIRHLIRRFDHLYAVKPQTFRLPVRFASDRWGGLGADVSTGRRRIRRKKTDQ